MNRKDRCFFVVNDQIGNVMKRNLTEIFTAMPEHLTNFGTKLIHSLFKMDSFTGNYSLQQSTRGFIISKSIRKEIKKFMNIW